MSILSKLKALLKRRLNRFKNWVTSRPALHTVTFAAPIVSDLLSGGCYILGAFSSFTFGSWLLLPLVWGMEGLASMAVASFIYNDESIRGVLTRIGVFLGLASFAMALITNPILDMVIAAAVGTTIVIGLPIWFSRKIRKGIEDFFEEMKNVG